MSVLEQKRLQNHDIYYIYLFSNGYSCFDHPRSLQTLIQKLASKFVVIKGQSILKQRVRFVLFLGEVSARQFCFEICCTSPRMENLYTKPNASQQIRRKWIIGINFFNFLYGKNWRWPLFLIQYWTKCMYPLAFANSVQVWLQKNTHLFYKFWLQSAQTVQKFALICISITSLHTFYIVLGN